AYGHLTQCRGTRHGSIGEYYAVFIPTKDMQCPCGHRFQTREHIIQSCELYSECRRILLDASKVSTWENLRGEEGIEVIAEFISASGVLTKMGRNR
ncbi:hypothetical protein GYMLUDRAFT_129129, partial [Collybiopsis luxurians FD-317 M1]